MEIECQGCFYTLCAFVCLTEDLSEILQFLWRHGCLRKSYSCEKCGKKCAIGDKDLFFRCNRNLVDSLPEIENGVPEQIAPPNGNDMHLDLHNNLQPHFLMNIGDQRMNFQDMLHRPNLVIHPALRQSAPLPGDPLPPNHPSPVFDRAFMNDSLPQSAIQTDKIPTLHPGQTEEMSELADLDAHSKLYGKKTKNGPFGLKKRCNFKVSMKKGTFFEKSKLPIDTVCKFVLFWCCMKHPTQEFLRNELSLATRTVVDWSTTCREICIHWAKSNAEKIGGDGIIVQVDEVRIAVSKSGDASSRFSFWGIEKDKEKGKIFIVPVAVCDSWTLLNILNDWVMPGSVIISNCWKSYDCLKLQEYVQQTVLHNKTFVHPPSNAGPNNFDDQNDDRRKSEDMHMPKFGTRRSHHLGDLAEFMFKRRYNNHLERMHVFFKEVARVYPLRYIMFGRHQKLVTGLIIGILESEQVDSSLDMLAQRLLSKWRIRRFFSTVNAGNVKVCIVGGGPAGFYAAQQLVKLMPEARVDIFERLPVPFGLVRFGVAPDHPEVKNVINTFTKTGKHPSVSFYGNLSLGKDFSIADLHENYHAVILSYGAEEDRSLNIPGEDLNNVIAARRFVGWYNGLPSDKDLDIDLSCDSAVVVGQGNVAVDVARILLSPIDKLKTTDITEHALERLSRSKINKVSLIGRRGPMQVAFTIKELRELLTLPGVQTVFQKDDFLGIDQLIPGLGRPRKRLTELLYKSGIETRERQERVLDICFKRSPIQITGKSVIEAIDLTVNKLQGDSWEHEQAVATDETETKNCGLLLRSIGYKGIQAEPALPFDKKSGVALNKDGRISNGLYCCGWLSTGPLGVILSTMTNAFTTAQLVHQDIVAGKLDVSSNKPGSELLLSKFRNLGTQIVTFDDWERIDREEEKRGQAKGKPREKIVDIDEMLRVAALR